MGVGETNKKIAKNLPHAESVPGSGNVTEQNQTLLGPDLGACKV